jgi:hypothetical protein
MADRGQALCTQALHGQNLVVHEGPRLQEGSGSPPLTLEDEPHGCQEVATWVKLSPKQSQNREVVEL